ITASPRACSWLRGGRPKAPRSPPPHTERRHMRTIGTSIQRVEDNRVLTGRGRYVDDVSLPRMLHAAFLRSPHPHARITNVDVSAATSMSGVVAVLTGADMQRLSNPLTVQMLPGYRSPQFLPLATDTV